MSFIIIFGTLSYPADSAAERRCLHRASSVELAVLKARFLIDTDRAARREICMDSGSPPRRGRPPATDTGDLRDRTFAPPDICTPFTQPDPTVAALLRVAGVTTGLAESNGSLPPCL